MYYLLPAFRFRFVCFYPGTCVGIQLIYLWFCVSRPVPAIPVPGSPPLKLRTSQPTHDRHHPTFRLIPLTELRWRAQALLRSIIQLGGSARHNVWWREVISQTEASTRPITHPEPIRQLAYNRHTTNNTHMHTVRPPNESTAQPESGRNTCAYDREAFLFSALRSSRSRALAASNDIERNRISSLASSVMYVWVCRGGYCPRTNRFIWTFLDSLDDVLVLVVQYITIDTGRCMHSGEAQAFRSYLGQAHMSCQSWSPCSLN
jgi:hypothetical protein